MPTTRRPGKASRRIPSARSSSRSCMKMGTITLPLHIRKLALITLIKDTSLANTIAVYELIYEAKEFMTVDGLIWPLFLAGGFYLLFVGVLTIAFGKIEKKLDYFKA